MIKEIRNKMKKRKEFIPIERVNLNANMYKPKINRKRQGLLGSLVLGDIILPATFGLGIMVTKLITKYNPLFLYR